MYVWSGYENMGFAQNFCVKTSWKIIWKTKDEVGCLYLRRVFVDKGCVGGV
jgi:hypothetical protein